MQSSKTRAGVIAALHLRALLLTTGVALVLPVPAAAQAQSTRRFDIAAQPLATALQQFMRQSGLQLTYPSALAEGRSANAVKGEMTAAEALSRLLAGTGLSFRHLTATTVTIEPAPATAAAGTDGAIALGPVRIDGEAGAIPGSFDGAPPSEGMEAYSIRKVGVGRMGESVRELPQAVSVITRDQLNDRNLNSVNDAIAVTTGAVLVQNDDVNERTQIFFRGFPVDALRVDGAAVSSNNDVMMFDTAIYDRIEVLRGPSGLFQGAGEAGGTINLVRKRAPDRFAVSGEAQVGSWQQIRVQADVGAPLDSDGGIRGRVVAAFDDSESFVDLIDSQRRMLFGTLDFDLSPATTLTIGSTWQESEGRNARGLPAYADGTLLDVPRSTYIGADWDHSETRSNDLFANLEHRFDGGAVLTATASFLDRKRDGKLAFAAAPVDPITGDTEIEPEHRIDRETNYNLDAHLLLPFDVGGLEQKLLVGADYRSAREEMDRARSDTIVQNVFDPIHAVPEPDLIFDRFDGTRTRQYGVYGQVRAKPVAWGTLVLGGRLSWWNTRSWDRESGETDSTRRENGQFTPFAAAMADIGAHLTAYISYASIFAPQDAVTVDNVTLKPRTGAQYEVGLKGEWLEGLLNGHMALFQLDEQDRAIADPDEPEFSIASGRVRSRGFEAELAGEVAPGWQLITGYTYVKTRYRNDPENAGLPFDPRTPRHTFRLWTHYKVEQGALAGLSLGGGLKIYGDFYRTDGGARFAQEGYETVDAQIGYRLSDGVKLVGTVTNLFDKRYFASVGYSERQSYFGRPRAFALKLSAGW